MTARVAKKTIRSEYTGRCPTDRLWTRAVLKERRLRAARERTFPARGVHRYGERWGRWDPTEPWELLPDQA